MQKALQPQIARVKIYDRPLVHPGKCVVCGSARSDDRDYIDFSFDIDYYGVVYFCTLCFAEIAVNCGFIKSSEIQDLMLDNKSLRTEVNRLSAKNGLLNATLRDCFNGGVEPHIDALGDVSSSETEGSDTVEGVGEAIDPTSNNDESVVVEGSNRVHNHSKNDRRKPESTDINDIFNY